MTRDEIAQAMQDSAGYEWGNEAHFQRFTALVAAAEREACKAIADQYAWSPEAKFIAAKIQERDET
jgi:hypothetical protein